MNLKGKKKPKRVVLGEGNCYMVRLAPPIWGNEAVELGCRSAIGIWNKDNTKHKRLNNIQISGQKIRLIAEIIE